MIIDGINRICPAFLDERPKEKGQKKSKSDVLERLSFRLSRFLTQLCDWVSIYPNVPSSESHLVAASFELKDLSIELDEMIQELDQYIEMIPENSDKDIAQDMKRSLIEDIEAVEQVTLFEGSEGALFSFGTLLYHALVIDESKLPVILSALFRKVQGSIWQDIKRLFLNTLRKCA